MLSSSWSRLIALGGGILSGGALIGCPPAASAAATLTCAATVSSDYGVAPVRTLYVYTGADGASHIRPMAIKGFTLPFFKTGQVVTETILGPSPKVVIVHGPANAVIPLRTSGGRGMFLTLAGSSTVVLADGEEATAYPGDLIVFDDTGSTTGHGGRTGACGYVAVSVPIQPGAPVFAEQH